MKDLTLDIPKGTYVIAVSGGVDSVVLLDLLTKHPDLNLVVAHFDHGIRQNSIEDRLLVQKLASGYRLPFVFDRAELGLGASEATARKYRYEFLESVRVASVANGVITAHHEDDVLETTILNILRGTNRKGMSSLRSRAQLVRPITHINKQDIYEYAKTNKLEWNEDLTNQDIMYKRNYVRHKILPRFNSTQRKQLVDIIKKSTEINNLIDAEVNDFLAKFSNKNELDRNAFIMLPHAVSLEIMASWLRKNGVTEFDRRILEVLTIGSKTLKPSRQIDVNVAYYLKINKDNLALINREC